MPIKTALRLIFFSLPTLLIPHLGLAEDFESLVEEYRNERAQLVRLKPERREAAITNRLAPILYKIGELNTPASYRFLVREFKGARGDLLPAVAAGLFALEREDVASLVLNKAYDVGERVRLAILDRMARAPRRYRSAEERILSLLKNEKSLRIRRQLVTVAGKLGTLRSAQALLKGIRRVQGNGKIREVIQETNEEIISAISEHTEPEVRHWLAEEAFKGASISQLFALMKVAESIYLTEARPKVISLLGHDSQRVVSRATEAVTRIGVGDHIDQLVDIAENIRDWDRSFQIRVLDTLAASGNARGLQFVLSTTKSSRMELRTFALGSLRYAKQLEESLLTLLAALRDIKHEVRNAALASLTSFRDKRMIAPLVGVVGRDRSRKLRTDAARLLMRLTGQDFGLQGEDWSNWWNIVEHEFQFGKRQEGVTAVRSRNYFGLDVNSERVAFLVDVSGSMKRGLNGFPAPEGERKIDALKAELQSILDRLPETSRVNIVPFHGIVMPWKSKLTGLSAGGRKRAQTFVSNLHADGNTNIYDALDFALKDADVEAIYLLSDGIPDRGKVIFPEEIVASIQLTNRIRGVQIHCIGFGADSYLLKALARDSGGDYRAVRVWSSGLDSSAESETETKTETASRVAPTSHGEDSRSEAATGCVEERRL